MKVEQSSTKPFPGDLLVIGTGSLVGSRFVEQLGPISSLYGANHKNPFAKSPYLRGFNELDILDLAQMRSVFEKAPGSYVINFSGYTNVGQAEKDRPDNPSVIEQLIRNPAYQVNVLGTRNILAAAKETGKLPILISTDFVFDGADGPYREYDEVAKSAQDINWYGWTKKLAEDEAKNSGMEYLMIRISYPFRQEFAGKGDFARDMITKAATKNPDGSIAFNYPLFTDQKLTPTFIDDLAPAIVVLVENNCRGIYHLSSPKIVNPFEFGCEMYRVVWGIQNPENQVSKGSLEKILQNGGSKKPLHGGLQVDKLIQDTGFTPTDWKTGIGLAFGKN